MFGGCLEGIYGMSKLYMGCLDVSEGQVRNGEDGIGQVRGQVKSVQVKSGQVKSGQVKLRHAQPGHVIS